jgi:alkylhydroperoxidase family enzyme
MTEDQIAALDSQWEEFSPADRAALEFARQLTLEPDRIGDADIEQLRLHFNEQQIVEIVFTIASNNSTNRWTDSLGIPQDDLFRDEPLKLDTPTSDRFRATRSKVAIELPRSRGPLPSAAEVTQQVEAARNRSPRVTVSESPAGQPAWVRVLAAFPKTAEGQQKAWKAVATEGKIPAELKARIRWTSARENRATYAIAHAWRELQALGVSGDEVFRGEQKWTSGESGSAEALRFARKLTAYPQRIADDDIARLRKHFSDHEVAEVVYVTCLSNWFDRFTEALGLPVEP